MLENNGIKNKKTLFDQPVFVDIPQSFGLLLTSAQHPRVLWEQFFVEPNVNMLCRAFLQQIHGHRQPLAGPQFKDLLRNALFNDAARQVFITHEPICEAFQEFLVFLSRQRDNSLAEQYQWLQNQMSTVKDE